MLHVGHRTEAGDTFVVTIVGDDPLAVLERVGEVPLPPYITEPLDDPERYQTVYAARPASAAAPTAGLHLTPELLDALAAPGRPGGLGRARRRPRHLPARHRARPAARTACTASATACRRTTFDACLRTRAAGGSVVAIGTTATRALESAAATGALEGRTRLFIHAPYEWQVVDVLLTNFHLPRTTLLMMIDAFVGPRWRDLYAAALADGYRFLSFGDAMLLRRERAR